MGKSITDLSSVTTVGLDLAKHVFQVHAIGAFGRVIVAKALRRKASIPTRHSGNWAKKASTSLRRNALATITRPEASTP